MKILATLIGILTAVTAGITVIANRERPGPSVVREPTASWASALVVYQPGLSSFPTEIATSFAEGLVAKGWRVEIRPISTDPAPDLTGYGLVAVISPTYWWTIAAPARRFVQQARGIEGKPFVAITTGAGHADRSLRILEEALSGRGAAVIRRARYYTWAPNDQAHYVAKENRGLALTMARALGAELVPDQGGRTP